MLRRLIPAGHSRRTLAVLRRREAGKYAAQPTSQENARDMNCKTLLDILRLSETTSIYKHIQTSRMTLLSTRVNCLSWTHEMLSMKPRWRECFRMLWHWTRPSDRQMKQCAMCYKHRRIGRWWSESYSAGHHFEGQPWSTCHDWVVSISCMFEKKLVYLCLSISVSLLCRHRCPRYTFMSLVYACAKESLEPSKVATKTACARQPWHKCCLLFVCCLFWCFLVLTTRIFVRVWFNDFNIFQWRSWVCMILNNMCLFIFIMIFFPNTLWMYGKSSACCHNFVTSAGAAHADSGLVLFSAQSMALWWMHFQVIQPKVKTKPMFLHVIWGQGFSLWLTTDVCWNLHFFLQVQSAKFWILPQGWCDCIGEGYEGNEDMKHFEASLH